MKIKSAFIMAGVIFSLSQLTQAQCPEICDNNDNTALGQSALVNNATGMNNTAVGFQALQHSNADGNTATGFQALMSNNSGTFNTAYGQQALSSNTTSSEHTAFGAFALASFTVGDGNTAVGYQALAQGTTIFNNTAVGWNALSSTTTGISDVAVGSEALTSNTTGAGNIALGAIALRTNTVGGANTAIGDVALSDNINGSGNTAVGSSSLVRNTSGANNIALGSSAGFFLTTGDNNIDIGNLGVAAESNTIRIGDRRVQKNTYIAGISGRTVAGGVGVLIDSQGHLGTNTSSARFKEQIKPMAKTSEAILSLKPVTFRYKKELDSLSIPQFGLVAEDVAKVNPDLVARDEGGKPYTVRYEAVNAMLLNEFLKEHRKVEEQATTITELKSHLDKLETIVKGQAGQIEAVSAALRETKSAAKLVINDR